MSGTTLETMNVPPWSRWVLDNTQMGLIVLDQHGCVVYMNQWIYRYAHISDTSWTGQPLTQVFSSLKGSYFEQVLQRTLKTGFAAFLSNRLHLSPFPLYRSAARLGDDSLMKQSIYILPMGAIDMQSAGQRFVLVQINDVTQAFNRERLLNAKASALHAVARMDSLTGIGNRRRFDETLAQEFRHAARSRQPLALIMVDLDRFKLYNDTYGHVKGDEALELVADAMRSACHRSRDTAARYGGEELSLILPETNIEGACTVALELQKLIRGLDIDHSHNPPSLLMTASMGVAVVDADGLESPKSLVERADLALYHAKQTGRDRICFFDGKTAADLVASQV